MYSISSNLSDLSSLSIVYPIYPCIYNDILYVSSIASKPKVQQWTPNTDCLAIRFRSRLGRVWGCSQHSNVLFKVAFPRLLAQLAESFLNSWDSWWWQPWRKNPWRQQHCHVVHSGSSPGLSLCPCGFGDMSGVWQIFSAHTSHIEKLSSGNLR